jgi:penicillin-binding protein 1C
MKACRAFAALALVAGLAPQSGAARPIEPSFEQVRGSFRPSERSVLDRHGRVVHETRIDPTQRRFAWVGLADISPALRDAVVSSEDGRFFSHHGVDFAAGALAAFGWLTGGGRRGASTITMQLAALIDEDLRRGNRPRSLGAKWRQMRRAWRLETTWTKNELLEAYLNLATFRGEVAGVGAASAVLFGKSPHALTRAEAAVMASLIRSPNATPEALVRRVRSLAAGGPPRAELDEAVARALAGDAEIRTRVTLAPHAARRLLPLGSGTDRVPSSLDLDLQLVARAALRRNLLALRERRVGDGAVLVIDNESGDVLAYVGSSGGLSASPHVDGVQARRQPGSTLKPFLYALAIERELLTAASLLDDAPLEIAVATGLYRPENYDGMFRGLVSLRTALAGSLNIPAVRTLQLIGEDAFVEHLRDLGFAGLTRPASYYGPALALGGAEASLWEIANAYRTLANGGVAGDLRLGGGEQAAAARRIYSNETAFITAGILADREARTITFGLESVLATPFWTAVKTGTSKDMRDNWCVGFSRRYTVAVWAGNFSGFPMADVSGISGAAPVWLEIMQWLHRDRTSDEPPPPRGVERGVVRFAAAGEAPRREWFRAATTPAADQMLARHRPRIVAPTDATIIALDPEIPVSQQRVAFEASGDEAITWVLDGTRLAAATPFVLWRPAPGDHELAIMDAAGRPVDRISFRVRGNT